MTMLHNFHVLPWQFIILVDTSTPDASYRGILIENYSLFMTSNKLMDDEVLEKLSRVTLIFWSLKKSSLSHSKSLQHIVQKLSMSLLQG